MKLSILEEPELEFGGGSRHVDIRFGIRDHGPFDLQSPRAPKEIRVGLIGSAESVEGAARWLEKSTHGVAQKQTTQKVRHMLLELCDGSALQVEVRVEAAHRHPHGEILPLHK